VDKMRVWGGPQSVPFLRKRLERDTFTLISWGKRPARGAVIYTGKNIILILTNSAADVSLGHRQTLDLPITFLSTFNPTKRVTSGSNILHSVHRRSCAFSCEYYLVMNTYRTWRGFPETRTRFLTMGTVIPRHSREQRRFNYKI
jgi:hypothetical protein